MVDPLTAPQPASNYNGYYLNNSNNNTTSNLLANTSTANTPDSLNAINNNLLNNPNYANKNSTNIQVPSEYDRYPSINGSRVVSSTSLSSTFFANAGQAGGAASNLNSKSDTGSSVSNRSASNPFLNSADFSPFGGYPASSFPLHIDEKEPDDYLHNPDPIADAAYDKNRFIHDLRALDKRSLGGLLTFIGLFIAAMAIFVVLPVVTFTGVAHHYTPETYEILTHYSYPIMASIRTALVDPDTPEDALTKKTRSGDTWPLVFSDEFNAEGRTFYEGDDQFFYAPDFHYAATTDLEWYDPDACTTANGTLVLRMDAFKNHNLLYRSGMIHSWNKMCFTQGLIEISAKLPHYGNISGLWPGLWTMGNLGRAGYMASTEGVWPYTYDSCDSGITANQSSLDGISYLPGQKLNVCTCKGEDHPNRGTGRGAPEIDLIEGEVSTEVLVGIASQSMQIAPYDIWYYPNYDFVEIYNLSVTSMNSYTGGPYQQAVSAVTTLNNSWYERGGGEHHFQHYGYEYLNDDTDGYCTWYVGDEPTFTVYANALAPNGNIGWRRISKEPMSIVMNFGLSNNWAYINWPSLIFPSELRIDYVRVYQPSDQKSVTCEPDDYPTQDYINDHLNAYQNVNLTSWTDAGYTFPKNSLVNGC
ncbi:beta-glucan synthesis-associated [Yamadazyma tenuis ATCC 10573]|uniref:Beta-glucan synthesis-associated n=1 Tax=Candida tenuis (strain ATCC 10573 / BCRC 21748 / CBS 615 / JCM 9827 / NBRC 10315 / NRRL Y-1498 / VKM Y-70) TaxID=590646 RepID=G3B8R8_CANTC|nr:beta-glucan synthesis-associated [Yamadazyma tenuis ATCC 10573]EGV62414.1 beta-glucan synthesis-associated [Yamadazyma tenuis ATCC 10573]